MLKLYYTHLRGVYLEVPIPVEIGDRVDAPRQGIDYIVASMEAPRHPGSTGRVYVRQAGRPDSTPTGYYPSVFNMKWMELSDHG